MTNILILTITAAVTLILLLIFSCFLFFLKSGRRNSNLLLAGFLLANSVLLINTIALSMEKETITSLHFLFDVISSFGFVFGPLLYLFTKSITEINYQISLGHLWHLVFFAIYLIAVIIGINIAHEIVSSALFVQVNYYLILSTMEIMKYRKKVKEYYSQVDHINLTWLLIVVGGFMLMWLIDQTAFISYYAIGSQPNLLINLNIFSILINLFFAIMIFYKALQKPEFFYGILKELEDIKYKDSRLSQQEKVKILKEIKTYFEVEKPFYDPSLKISDIAIHIEIPTKYISQVINESFNKNFYDFINTYRIRSAMNQLLQDKNKTILEILYESGFNSKSAFNKAFKKHNGITPTEYRNINSYGADLENILLETTPTGFRN